MLSTGAVFNEAGADADFRVESDTLTSALFVDGGTGNVTMQGAITTIGAGLASTNIEFRLSGYGSKATRIAFSEGATDRWLLGQGAASETSAFELYNSAGTIALKFDRTTNAATFADDITLGGTAHRVWGSGYSTVQLDTSAMIYGNASSISTASNLYYNSGWKHVATGAIGINVNEAGYHTFYTGPSGSAGAAASFSQRLSINPTGNVTINEDGLDADFRIESDSYASMLFVDGGANHVCIGTNSDLSGMLNVAGDIFLGVGSGNPSITIKTDGAGNNPHINYRAGSSTVFDTMLVASAATDYWRVGYGASGSVTTEILAVRADKRVGINQTAPTRTLHVADSAADPYVLVDGSAGNRDSGFSINAGGGQKIAIRGDSAGSLYYGNENQMLFNTAGATFNEGSAVGNDLRVESDTNAHALFLDAGNDVLTVGYSDRNGAFVDKAATGLQIGTPGVDDNGGHMFMTQTAPESTWMDICAAHDDGATGVLFLIHGVRTIDQNRSYGALVRYAYNDAFNIMSVNSQNATIEYRVSGNVLQYRFTTAGPYVVNLTIMAAG
tara:strand:- start:342 stop:2012 length:1671 start_codon:yes stop_codon:yes gene_type:complete